MSTLKYPVPMSQWMTTAIVRLINTHTGKKEGNDAGYKRMHCLPWNSSPLVEPNVLIRAVYDGTNEYGKRLPETALPGGLRDGKLMLRETAARAIDFLNQLVLEASHGFFQIVALDGFRSGFRQKKGFSRLLAEMMNRMGVTSHHHEEKLAEFITAGIAADETFAQVDLKEGEELLNRIDSLLKDGMFVSLLREATGKLLQKESVTEDEIHKTLIQYLTISANCGFGRGVGLPLHFENNAHAGAGSCDLMPVRVSDGKLFNIVPFDYPGGAAAADFMEGEDAYVRYLDQVSKDKLLSDHLIALGFKTPHDFKLSDWLEYQSALRLVYHASKAIGCTYYSGEIGGENWHIEPGNAVIEPSTGDIIAIESLTFGRYPHAGNAGHTLQKLGPKAKAVWGGASAHAYAAAKLGLQI